MPRTCAHHDATLRVTPRTVDYGAAPAFLGDLVVQHLPWGSFPSVKTHGAEEAKCEDHDAEEAKCEDPWR